MAWRILTNEPSLWVRAMQDKYLCKTSLLNYTSKGTQSPIWRNVLRCRQLLRQGIRWKLGKGDKILFWLDDWLKNRTLLEILGLHVDAVSHPYAKVNKFITPHKRWDLYKLNHVIHNSTIIQQIRGIDIAFFNMEDSVCWGLHSSGEFTTKYATWLAYKTYPLSEPDWDHKWIRIIDLMPKILIFL